MKHISINEFAEYVHANNVEKGFYEEGKNIGEMLCLVHSEVSEALECDRKNKYCELDDFKDRLTGYQERLPNHPEDELFKDAFKEEVKDTFEDELADIVIRVMDLAAFKGIDLEQHIKLKMRYNSMRQYKHGKKY